MSYLRPGGGQNRDFCDCAGAQHSFTSPFRGIVKVYIFVGTALPPNRRVYFSHLRRSGCGGLKTRNFNSTRYVHVSLSWYLILLTWTSNLFDSLPHRCQRTFQGPTSKFGGRLVCALTPLTPIIYSSWLLDSW